MTVPFVLLAHAAAAGPPSTLSAALTLQPCWAMAGRNLDFVPAWHSCMPGLDSPPPQLSS